MWQGKCVQSIKVSNDWQKSLAVYPDGRRLLVSGGGGRIPSDHAIRLFDLLTPTNPVLKQAVTLSDDPFQHAAILPTRGLAANLIKRQLVIFNPASGQIIQ
jgi:WD40 repeat protein